MQVFRLKSSDCVLYVKTGEKRVPKNGERFLHGNQVYRAQMDFVPGDGYRDLVDAYPLSESQLILAPASLEVISVNTPVSAISTAFRSVPIIDLTTVNDELTKALLRVRESCPGMDFSTFKIIYAAVKGDGAKS